MPRLLTVDALIARGWPPFADRTDLACNPDNASLFHRNDRSSSSSYDPARRICARCPAREECAKWAIDTRQAWGVWGGMTAYERAVELRHRQRLAAVARILVA